MEQKTQAKEAKRHPQVPGRVNRHVDETKRHAELVQSGPLGGH